MKLSYQKEKTFTEDYITTNLLQCLDFWNREGEKIYRQNINGELGTDQTNEMARTMQLDDWLNEMMLIDAKTFCNSTMNRLDYNCGRTRSHVWIHQADTRVLIFYADPDHQH